ESGRPRPREIEERGLSPVRAFALVAVLATALGAAFFATRDAVPSEPPRGPVRSPDYSLTDAEAIAEFERLHDLQVRAYEERDVSLIPVTYTADSPVRDRVEREVANLVRKRVTTQTSFTTRRLMLVSNLETEIVLDQTAVIDAAFFNGRGVEISISSPPEVQHIRWTLRQEDHRWLIHDAEILASRPVRDRRT
ncbi:MAG TPA: hypothetical protein VHN37_02215, partial [Actinomycetota bacterium]|nr:hypothetical protein [Actinomycetota bacterium]